MGISLDFPGNGMCVTAEMPRNPFNPADGVGSARAAWHHSLATTTSEIRVLLAGPLSEAKALGKPLRSLGARSDLEGSLRLAKRLHELNLYVSQFADVEWIDADLILDQERCRVLRWLGGAKTWRAVSRIACLLLCNGQIDWRQLDAVIGSAALQAGQQILTYRQTSARCLSSPSRSSPIGEMPITELERAYRAQLALRAKAA